MGISPVTCRYGGKIRLHIMATGKHFYNGLFFNKLYLGKNLRTFDKGLNVQFSLILVMLGKTIPCSYMKWVGRCLAGKGRWCDRWRRGTKWTPPTSQWRRDLTIWQVKTIVELHIKAIALPVDFFHPGSLKRQKYNLDPGWHACFEVLAMRKCKCVAVCGTAMGDVGCGGGW